MNITQLINQHSYLIVGAALIIILALLCCAWRKRQAWFVWIAVTLILSGGWLLLRTGSPARADSVETIQAAISSGRPTLVEFYSDY